MSKENNHRRDFIKKSVFALAGLSLIPGFGLAENNNTELFMPAVPGSPGNDELKTVAFICNTYRNSSHADVIGTKLFLGIPTDEGMVTPR